MENSTTYTLYFMKKLGNEEQAVIDISRPGDRTQIESKERNNNLESLAQNFVGHGWRISNKDRIQTISPIILNEWAPKPWNEESGIESLIEDGEMILYRNLTSEELDAFYGHYLSAVETKRAEIKKELGLNKY